MYDSGSLVEGSGIMFTSRSGERFMASTLRTNQLCRASFNFIGGFISDIFQIQLSPATPTG